MKLKHRIWIGVGLSAALLFGAYGPGSPLRAGPAKASGHTYTCREGSPDGTEAFTVGVDARTIVCFDN